jgi:glycosyltransferase involved in cell wall biosynthesis
VNLLRAPTTHSNPGTTVQRFPSELRRSPAPRREASARETRPAISAVVPCRNEAVNLPALLRLLSQTLTELTDHWEMVLVDDGSTDGSTAVFDTWLGEPGVRVLQLSRSFGKEAALSAGLDAARGDVVVILDADLQHPPALLGTLLQRWREGADVAYAVREDRRDEGPVKRAATRWFYHLLNFGDRFEVPPDAGDFRLLDRRVVDALVALPERNRFMKGLYAWVGFEAVPVPYRPEPRAAGRSHFGPWRLLQLSLDGLTGFTTWPLRLVSVVGTAFALLGFSYAALLSGSYLLFGNSVSGWTTIVVGMLTMCGMLMISLGIVGEYIARIFEEVKGRPLYLVKHERGRGLPARVSA